MSRVAISILLIIFCVSCRLSPFKENDSPHAPSSAEAAPVEKIMSIRRPTLDFAIESKIEDVLRLNDDQFSAIRASVKNGVVTLSGTLPGDWYKARLIDVVEGTSGVRRVIDHLEVKSAAPATTSPPQSAEESSFPWLAVEIAAVILIISTLIWAVRRRRTLADDKTVRA